MLTCTINGQTVQVPKGTSIIEAFKYLGKDICHYCWHPGLSVAGVCRLCVVEIKGMAKPQIACNTKVTEGMVITNQSADIKKTVEWGLNFHLINHPLDCPICDQAGECGLQDQYMQYGKYKPSMSKAKVKKRKVVDLGSKIVLDTERCILCSRCVRFTDEVTQTHELGIFNRGDRSEIGTHKDRPLENDYALNTVDICPVGALTSKDFRFNQRVWYLKKVQTVCSGCSTGCNVDVYYNEEGLFRVKPVYNEDVNGHWMCDKGRDIYKFVNKEKRLQKAQVVKEGKVVVEGLGLVQKNILNHLKNPKKTALILTGQFTCEEYESVCDMFEKKLNISQIYHWKNEEKKWNDFDDILIRGDKNPNSFGLMEELKKRKISNSLSQLLTQLDSKEIETLVVAAPENQKVYLDLEEKLKHFTKANQLIWLSAHKTTFPKSSCEISLIPLKSFFEKDGHFKNYKGLSQKIKKGTLLVKGAISLVQFSHMCSGKNLDQIWADEILNELKTNYFPEQKGVVL